MAFDQLKAILGKVPAGTVHQLWNNGILKLAHCQCPCMASVQVCPQYFREIRNRQPSGQTFTMITDNAKQRSIRNYRIVVE
ncbi:hypothetical protein T12_2202 [Trichinella patagoniensis]|uniref:Uncharacterized protein n=1 Tax=Trichinella patagoniensis TaxID=990121 RepID=A0A0V1A358_9BILA|nr:hypothetical protein T12_2202 [Trichinella patagoniensis]